MHSNINFPNNNDKKEQHIKELESRIQELEALVAQQNQIITELKDQLKKAPVIINMNTEFACILEKVDKATVTESLDGMIIYWDIGAEELYGYSKDEVIGKPLSFIIPDNQMNEYLTAKAKLTKAFPKIQLETARKHKNGNIILLRITLELVYIDLH